MTSIPVSIRKIEPADFERVVDVLGRAFDDDPVMNFIAKQDARRSERIRHMMRMALTKMTYPHGEETFVGSEFEGAALWNPPGRIPHGLLFNLQLMPEFVRVAGLSGLARAGNAMQAVEKLHPKEPHYYLLAVGVDPARQGQGVGTQLIRHVLDRADREHMPAYLESSKAVNVPLYERLGFKVTRELTLPGGGPQAWAMWRDPA